MKKALLFFAALCFWQLSCPAQSFNQAWAGRFQEVLDSIVAANPVVGASAAVLVPGEGIWTGASGYSSPNVLLTPYMSHGIGSNTKLFIAVVMAKLQEEGVLSFDDQLSQWLPACQNVNPSITIRQLLSHQSGIYNFTDNIPFWDAVYADTAYFWTPQEVLGYLQAPNFEPGTAWGYSNTNYILAGMIIEAVSGKTWIQELHEVIFDPLDLDSTFVGAYESPTGPVAATYLWGAGGGWYLLPATSIFSSVGAAGAIMSTPQEMVQWYNALFTGEIVSDSSLQQILNFESASLYGLGIYSDCDTSHRYPWFTHTGWLLQYISKILYDKHTQSVFCVLTNAGYNPYELLNTFTDPMMHVLYDEYPQKIYDAGISKIISPGKHSCIASFTPQLILKNYGSDPLTSLSIHCKLDAGSPATFAWTGNLAPGDTLMITLAAITPGDGLHTLSCYTSNPNGSADEYPYNDTISVQFLEHGSAFTSFPLEEGFENDVFPPQGWIMDPDIAIHWGHTELTAYSGLSCAVKGNFLDEHIGSIYNLDLPMLNLNSLLDPELDVLYAYAPFAGATIQDSLKILISSDCGANWQTLFCDGGYSLATTLAMSYAFFPSVLEWSQITISLAGYSGHVLIRFQVLNGYSNNLFIDDVKVWGIPTGFAENLVDAGIPAIYPNPFRTTTTLAFSLDSPGYVVVSIYDQLGKEVATPVNEFYAEGKHQVLWNAAGMPAGIYYCRLQAGDQVSTNKIIKM